MFYGLAVLFILGNVVVALGVVPITPLALAVINAIGWLLAMLSAAFLPYELPWRRS